MGALLTGWLSPPLSSVAWTVIGMPSGCAGGWVSVSPAPASWAHCTDAVFDCTVDDVGVAWKEACTESGPGCSAVYWKVATPAPFLTAVLPAALAPVTAKPTVALATTWPGPLASAAA